MMFNFGITRINKRRRTSLIYFRDNWQYIHSHKPRRPKRLKQNGAKE